MHNVKYPTPERCWHQGARAASANVTHDINVVDRDQFQSEVLCQPFCAKPWTISLNQSINLRLVIAVLYASSSGSCCCSRARAP